MIVRYKSEGGKLSVTDDIGHDTWIRVTQPSGEDIASVSALLGTDVYEVNALLDRDEGSRWETEGDVTTIIVDIPYRRSESSGPPYDTLPFAIIMNHEVIATICQIESTVIQKIAGGAIKNLDLADRKDFVLKILYMISLEYQVQLREINTRRKEIESKVNYSTENSDIIELHNLESSLVYFSTSLTACNVVLDKMKRNAEKSEDARHLDGIHDVLIENQQAVEMSRTYRSIIDGTRELFAAVMNNRLNAILKWLTAVTIILAIPAIISGFWGMNVTPLPFDNTPWGFWIVLAITVVICAAMTYAMKRKKMM